MRAGTVQLVDTSTFAATLSTTGTVTHNLSTRDIIVQLYELNDYISYLMRLFLQMLIETLLIK